MRNRRLVAAAGLAVVVAGLLSACNSPTAGPGTGGGTLAGAPTAWYPPVPPTPSESVESCVGRAPTGMTTAAANQIVSRINATLSGVVLSVGACTGGPVFVGLAPGAEHDASQPTALYGNDVVIAVGLTAFDGSPGLSPVCGEVPPTLPVPAGLHLTLVVARDRLPSGSSFQGGVVVSEKGSGSIVMDTGQPLQAVIVRPGTRRVVGVFAGAIGGTGFGPRLHGGQPSTIPVVGGTARCDGGIGSALPPGNYQALVVVAPESAPHLPAYLTPAVTIRVTAS